MSKKRHITKKSKARVPGTTVRPLAEHRRVCLLVGGHDGPVVAVTHQREKVNPRDSGYVVFTNSAPEPNEATESDFRTYCVACLVFNSGDVPDEPV